MDSVIGLVFDALIDVVLRPAATWIRRDSQRIRDERRQHDVIDEGETQA